MVLALHFEEVDWVELALSGACPLAALGKDLRNFFGNAVLLCDVEEAHELLGNQAKNHNYD
jgi:hypothetical protein